jgi:hypothetical protein
VISYAIMAHPRRRHFVGFLKRQLPQATVVWDKVHDPWDTGRRAMLAYDPKALWHVVVQDDAILCEGFTGQVERALDELDHGPAAFYMGQTGRFDGVSVRGMMEMAKESGERWIVASGPRWGPAVAVQTREIGAMIQHGDAVKRIRNYDLRMESYFQSIGRPCHYSAPSLVDHRVGYRNRSLIKGRGQGQRRTAAWWETDGSPHWKAGQREQRSGTDG